MSESLQQASVEYQKMQSQLSDVVEARQRLDAQLGENELVKKEFELLTPENTVYKLIGPVLVKQDQMDAKTNVNARLEFLKGEIKRVETQLNEMTVKSELKRQEIAQLQSAMQQQQQPQVAE